MRRITFGLLSAVALLLTMSAQAGMGAAQAQETDDTLIPVCVENFESPVHVEYLTQAEIDGIEAEWAAYDNSDIPPPRIVGSPDPATESCATENGVLRTYDPAFFTPVCVPSGPEGDGPLVPQFVSNHYLPGYGDVILADPVTGACDQDGAVEPDDIGTDPVASDDTVNQPVVEVPAETRDAGDADDPGPEANVTHGTSPDGGEAITVGSGDQADSGDNHDITALPATGSGTAPTDADRVLLLMALSALAALITSAGLRIRHQS